LLGDEAYLGHAGEDIGLPFLGPFKIIDGGIATGGLDQASHHGYFRQIELLGPFVKVTLGGRSHPIGSIPQIDIVQVKAENLLFG